MTIENVDYISTDGLSLSDEETNSWGKVRDAARPHYSASFEFKVQEADSKSFLDFFYPPRFELLCRVNDHWHGRDPGKPRNWKGLPWTTSSR